MKLPNHDGAKSSGIIAAGSTTPGGVGKPVILFSYNLAGGSTASSVTFKDGGTGGTVLWSDSIKAQTAAGDATVNVALPYAMVFTTDMYVTVTGTGATAICIYIPL